MGLIATAHDVDGYDDEQVAEMLLIHSMLDRGPLFVNEAPAMGCDESCELCQEANA